MSEWRRTVSLGKRDTAEPDVIKAFLGAGATVRQLSGKDTPDLLIGYLGQDHTVEVKTNRAKLRPGQRRFAETWNGSPPVVARTPAQARRWLKRWEEDAKATRIDFPRESPPVDWTEAVEAEQRRVGEPLTAGKDLESGGA